MSVPNSSNKSLAMGYSVIDGPSIALIYKGSREEVRKYKLLQIQNTDPATFTMKRHIFCKVIVYGTKGPP